MKFTAKFAKSILMGTGSVVLAGLILALLVPKAAHAIAATAVMIENTMANPVPTVQAQPPGSDAFATSCVDVEFCNLLPAVPAGKRFVIQTLSNLVNTTPPVTPVVSYKITTAGKEWFWFNTLTPNPIAANTFSGNPMTQIYQDSGATISCDAQGSVIHSNNCVATGYLIPAP